MTETQEWGEEPPPGEGTRRFPLWAKLAIALCVCSCLGLGLLATLVVPSVMSKLSRAQEVKAMADIMTIRAALDELALRHGGQFPASLETLLVPDAEGRRFLDSASMPLDPWGRVYGYEPPADGSAEFRVFSLGADGRPGGEGEDRDLDNLLIRAGKL